MKDAPPDGTWSIRLHRERIRPICRAFTARCFSFAGIPAAAHSSVRARIARISVCPAPAGNRADDNGLRLYDTGPNLALPFRHFEFVRKRRGPFEHDQFAHTFFCLQQDWLDGKNSTGARTALASNKSRDWGVAARVRAVEDGLRDLGQQTLELITQREQG
jgi:hypothetical protein